jgi:pimeloyl-ACP methyl ester carboxylesterase
MTTAEQLPGVWTHHEAVVNGVRLHYVAAGSGPPVLLLHGFPEFWYSWRHQIPVLAAAGFRVLAPDLRGYNLSDKPKGIHHYRLDCLADDVLGLIRQAGHERAAVVGHDWGGVIAWWLAMQRPQAVQRLAVLNAAHPAAYLRELRTLSQLLKSWYVFFFQLPWLPELVVRRGNFADIERKLRREPVHPGAFSDADIEHYKQALARPGALTAALNYYRAAFRSRRRMAAKLPLITAPTLLIWGERDAYGSVRLTEGLERWVRTLRVERLPDASHWVQNDAAPRVNDLLIAWLRNTVCCP